VSRNRNAAGLRRRSSGPGQQVGQPAPVERVGAGRHHLLGALEVVGGQVDLEVVHLHGGLVRRGARQQHRQPGRGRGAGQLPHLRVGLDAGGEQQRGEAGAVERGEAGRHDDLVAVARHDDEPALGEHVQPARHGLGEDAHLADAPALLALRQHLRPQVGDEVAHPGLGERPVVRHRAEQPELVRRQGPLEPLPRPAGDLRVAGRHARDDAADDARPGPRLVRPARDREALDEALEPGVVQVLERLAAAARPGGHEDHRGVDRGGERAVHPSGVDLRRAGLEPLDDHDVVRGAHRLPPCDDLLEHVVEVPRAQVLLHDLGRQRGRRVDAGQRADEVGGVVRAALRVRLGERLDVPGAHAAALERAEQAEARAGEADGRPVGTTSRVRPIRTPPGPRCHGRS
jgi:hypothetical protein